MTLVGCHGLLIKWLNTIALKLNINLNDTSFLTTHLDDEITSII